MVAEVARAFPSSSASTSTTRASREERVERVRRYVREIERFAYGEVAAAETGDAVAEAQAILRITVGLRRKLDRLK